MNPEQARELALWLAEKSAAMRYGTCQVLITVHDGQIRYIDKTVSEKMKIEQI